MKCILPVKKPSCKDNTSLTTLTQHYYPECGWGWVIVAVSVFIHSLLIGFIMNINCLRDDIRKNFGYYSDWLGNGCLAMSLIISPLIVTICKRKSIRLFSIISGLIVALGCLFASFANQFHQIVISFGIFFAIGVGMSRDCSLLMIGQYFKKRRPFVEIFIMSGTGFGFGVIPTIQRFLLNKFQWRLTLQIFAILMSSVFFLSTLYRSASLYHPQRRAILHLKNQRRKIKDKYTYFNQQIIDFSILRKRNIRLILFSNFLISFGIYTPLFSLTTHIENENLLKYKLTIFLILGTSWIFGCLIFGLLLIIKYYKDISRQYLCQFISFFISLTLIVFITTNGNVYMYILFSVMYGFFMGAYQYSIKLYIYEIIKSKKFAQIWSFVQFIQAIPIAVSVPIQETISYKFGNKCGYYFGIFTILMGTILICAIKNERTKRLLIEKSVCTSLKSESDNYNREHDMLFDLQKRNQCVEKCLQNSNINDFQQTFDSEIDPNYKQESYSLCGDEITNTNFIDNLTLANNCNYDFITSCDKDEKFLMLSEFENNLITIIPKSKSFSNK